MDWTRLTPDWVRTIFFFFFAKELTTGEWVKGILSQALTTAQIVIVGAFKDVGSYALGSTSLMICVGVVASIAGSALITTYLIRGRHRTHESNMQNTTATTFNPKSAPTNIISIQSAMQHGTEPQLQNHGANGIETFNSGMDLGVWWAKLKIKSSLVITVFLCLNRFISFLMKFYQSKITSYISIIV